MLSFAKKVSVGASPAKSPKFLLHRHLSGFDPARSVHRIHASELTKPEGFCPRRYALLDVTKTKPKDKWLTTSENVTYSMGRWLQDQVVNWFADMDMAISHWECMGCRKLFEFQKRPQRCGDCGVRSFAPKEVRFEDPETKASGGIDMLLSLGDPKLLPVEIKTIDKDQFKALAAPLGEHRLRTSLYLNIIEKDVSGRSDLVNCQEGLVFYVSKGAYGCADAQLEEWGLTDKFSPFKEYRIKRNDAGIKDLLARAKAITDFRAGKVGMPCGTCATALIPRATRCDMKKHCFSGEHPASHDWKELASTG